MKPERLEEMRKLAGMQTAAESHYQQNMTRQALSNTAFRRVLYTGPKIQLALMSIPVGGEVGKETHKNVEQTFQCMGGKGVAILNGSRHTLRVGDSIVVRPGTSHNVLNTGSSPLKLFTTYSPPEHPPGTLQQTKAIADAEDR